MAKLERKLGLRELAEEIRPFFSSENTIYSDVLEEIREFLKKKGVVNVGATEVVAVLNVFFQRDEILLVHFVTTGENNVIFGWRFKSRP